MHKSKASNQPKFQYIASAVKEEKKDLEKDDFGRFHSVLQGYLSDH